MWRCPLCQTSILLDKSPIKCANNHSFDKAKSGYVNLLPVQFKKSKKPGDDKAMVTARREFHRINAYKPLKDRIAALILAHLPHASENPDSNYIYRVYDAGCGEGSYLHELLINLQANAIVCSGAGSDISKVAVELAAKAYKSEQFVVASSFDMPVLDNSQDVVIQVFAPGSDSEYARVLKPGGILVTVDPSYDHLYELKQAVYDNPQKHTPETQKKQGFEQIKSDRLTFPISFESTEQCLALIKMTPFFWKLPQDKLNHIIATLSSVTADFHITVWENA